MTVRLYHWNTVSVLRRYSSGDIIVAADSVEAARDAVRRAFIKFIKDGEQCHFSVDEYADDEDESKAAWARATAALEEDLAKEPQVGDVVFVWGSE